ncbi:hypothetical protein G7B11_29455, partial [Klebsiella pneumoniae]|nr:hypothetical protein [Klebsiella pneumoniae]
MNGLGGDGFWLIVPPEGDPIAIDASGAIAVVYPHMNGLGGDGFWLIVPPEGDPIAIDASGA